MAGFGSITLLGKSGESYKFLAYPLGTVFKDGFAAVYVITERGIKAATGAMRHKPLIFGQSADLGKPEVGSDNALYAAANCICVHAERNEARRQKIQQDIMRIPSKR